MAIIYSLSEKVDGVGKKEILIRYKSGKYAARAKSCIYVLPEWYNFVVGNQSEHIYKGKRIITDEMKEIQSYHEIQKAQLSGINILISEELKTIDRDNSDWLRDCLDKYYQRGQYTPTIEKPESKQSFFDIFNEFLDKHKLSDIRKNNFKVVLRALKRYELYKQEKQKKFTLSFDTFTADTLDDIVTFLRQEHKLYETHSKLYEQVPESRTPEPRGQNTINGILTKIRTFIIWCVDKGKTDNNPFRNYSIEECVYGTPYYISIDERNQLYHTDLSHRPALAIQRDIFVFQCLIGCRVADLYKFTKQNIINGAIEYIARKTKDGRPVTVRVPLNSTAKEILDRYTDFEGKKLLPFISEQKYNKAIKDAFLITGLTRNVVILDTLTRESVIRPLNEIASSHLARRCFVGNLYKQVKDPNLVGALSGHKEGSKSFARYREIDEEMKSELVKMLE
ncbi:MAG: site-specific integrase [Prevotellaceae bacterium]|nr:site-specific integrase [Prevotellaceae bacterium]